MGYMRHHAIVVTSCNEATLEAAHAEASRIFEYVSPISPAAVNGYRSFFVPPDGSKEGWEESDAGGDRRLKLLNYLRDQSYDDGSSSLDWVEVQYGDDNHQTAVTADSDEHARAIDEVLAQEGGSC